MRLDCDGRSIDDARRAARSAALHLGGQLACTNPARRRTRVTTPCPALPSRRLDGPWPCCYPLGTGRSHRAHCRQSCSRHRQVAIDRMNLTRRRGTDVRMTTGQAGQAHRLRPLRAALARLGRGPSNAGHTISRPAPLTAGWPAAALRVTFYNAEAGKRRRQTRRAAGAWRSGAAGSG